MIERREGLTDKINLASAIVIGSSIPITIDTAIDIIDRYLERCIEIYIDGELSGYALIFMKDGERTFHGYKLVPGYSVAAFRTARAIVKEYKDIAITSTADKTQVRRLARLLGFKETINVIKMERKA